MVTTKKTSDAQKKALKILANKEWLSAREFAAKMWPDSKADQKGKSYAAGMFLQKLWLAGLVTCANKLYKSKYVKCYRITEVGLVGVEVDSHPGPKSPK